MIDFGVVIDSDIINIVDVKKIIILSSRYCLMTDCS